MGGGAGGNFGKTKGSTLDAISNILAVASLIPGADSFTNAVSIPVDILRGDWLSVGLDVLGVIPLVGEAGDALKLAKLSDKASDASKIVKRSAKGETLLKRVKNQRLRNTIKEMYRPGAQVGDGGLADAIRSEIKTGNLVGEKSHIQKGKERLRNLERILKNEKLDRKEKRVVLDLIDDLKQALEGK